MDFLWSPWRYRYVTEAPHPSTPEECVFCGMLAGTDDRQSLLLHRGPTCFVALNRFPYSGGHLLILPNAHVASLRECSADVLSELILLAQKSEEILKRVYDCPGLNMGLNLGTSAGAGVAGHLHLHVVPRWNGDVNFMTSIGETRVLPEELATTYGRLAGRWG